MVTRIVDGDTLECGGGLRVRLLLIDAPEDEKDSFSLRASLALEELLPVGYPAIVAVDAAERDRYGRVLAHLYNADGLWVNEAMVRTGYAVPLVYEPNVAGLEAIMAAEVAAREDRSGLWRLGGFTCVPVEVRAGRCGGGE